MGNTSGTNLGAGNPINILTGNKYQRETDMAALPGELGVEIVRHYNSLDRSRGSFGVGWRLSYDTELSVIGNTIQISESDGHRITFARSGLRQGGCVGADPASGIVQIIHAAGGTRYVWTWPNGRRLSFNAAGKLQEITDGRGGLLTLTRGLRGELLAVSDPLGRQLTIQYEPGDGGRIAAIRSPLGTFTYAYPPGPGGSAPTGLAYVTLSDGRTIRRYHYESRFQAGNAHALTGISVQTISEDGKWSPSQRLSTYGYDASGRAIWSMRGNGIESVSLGRSAETGTLAKPAIAVLVNARGERTRYAFAVIGGEYRLLSADGPGCAHCGPGGVRYEYDANGRMSASMESNASGAKPRRTEYEYDAAGRLSRIRAPSVIDTKLRTVEYLYGGQNVPAGIPVARVERGFAASGAISRRVDYTFDARARLVADGSTRIAYDARGRVAERRGAGGAVTRYEYDALSRASRITLPDGRVVHYAYDARGQVASIDIDGRVERYEYDAAERLSRVIRPNGERLDYRYDAADRVADVTDANGNRIAFDRDREGELLRREFYDTAGTLLQRRDDRPADVQSSPSAIELDGSGRPVGLRGAIGAVGSYEYDDFGRLTAVYLQAGGWTRFEYDDHDRLTARILANGTRIAYQHDPSGRRVEMAAPEGRRTLQLGLNQRPSAVEYPGGRETFDYDHAAHLVEHTRKMGGLVFKTRYRYGADGQLREQQLPGGQTLLFTYRRAPARNAGLLDSIQLVDNGVRTTLLSGLNGAGDTLNHRTFTLLGRAQFQRELDVDGKLRTIGAAGYWQQSFGPNGNSAVSMASALARLRAAPAATRDVSGAILDDGLHHFEWDSESRLVGVVSQGRRIASYSYDADGQRISKTVFTPDGATTTRFLYERGKLIAEVDSRGNVSKQYVWLDDQPIAIIDGERVYGVIADQTFAPRAVFDRTGNVEVSRVTQLRGSHQYFDAETGLLYNGRRFLDPATASYLSVDPLGVAGGPDPYAFAAGDPARFVDLRGLQAQPVAAEAAAVDGWSLEQKLGYIFRDAARQIQDHELAAALRELISPGAIATTAIIFSTWAASQFTPYGWVADIALTGVGALFLGKSIWDVIETTYQLARGLTTARCQSDLHDAASLLAQGLSRAAASLAAAGATGAAVGGIRVARLLRTVFRRDLPQLRRSSSFAVINQQRFGVFNPSRGAYSGRAANLEWMALQRANGRSDAHPPWDPAKSVVDTWLNPGDKIYIIQDRSAGPGGWATAKQYQSLDEARNELSILQEFKRSDADLVLQEYTVTTAMPVREGFSGPQVSGWPASETYVGGGRQIQFLMDLRGTAWEQFLTPAQTIEFSK